MSIYYKKIGCNKMYKKRQFIKNKSGISPVLESLVAVGISISLLIIFFIATSNVFSTHDRPNVDLEAKCSSITESLTSSPGLESGHYIEWGNDPDNVDFTGLATTRTIAYGEASVDENGEMTILSYYNFSDSNIGIAGACFLAGTKVVLADESHKNIEDIKIGDTVKAFDEETGRIVDSKVTKVFHHDPKEMGKYYLVINDQLKVTPNHRFYSNEKWVCADNLKIGDALFYPSSNYKIYSIKRIFEREPTYNFEVEGNHNYFVALDRTDVLVHNDDLVGSTNQTYHVTPYGSPFAEFKWFDCDGPYIPGTKIFFNAADSYDTYPQSGYIKSYEWWFDWDLGWDLNNPPVNYNAKVSNYTYIYTYPDNDVHYVRLKVIDNSDNNDSWIYAIQANRISSYKIDYKPWILTSKNIYPETGNDTLIPYGKDYYIKYNRSAAEDASTESYMYEIKEKKKSAYTILDLEKIKNIRDVIYYDIKASLGFNTTANSVFNFNISVTTETDVYEYGANYSETDLLRSVKKEVLIYHKPQKDDQGNIIPPFYEKGEITVRVFLGGVVPNYPPRVPRSPNPVNGETNVRWNVVFSWIGGDPNGADDHVTYDVFFGEGGGGTGSIPAYVGTVSTTYYDPPGILKANTAYTWMITARDSHGATSTGPAWWFTTKSNTPPYAPSNPKPPSGQDDVSVELANIAWTCDDPDIWMGDRLFYEAYFTSKPPILPPVSCHGWNHTYWDPKEICTPYSLKPRLNYNTTYCWKIRANDTHGGITYSPGIWDFTTAEKGLDQYCKNASGEGIDTGEYKKIGQLFIAGRTGNLTKIKFSLESRSGGGVPPPYENITVEIYECDDPNSIKSDNLEPIATTNITDFNDATFVWKIANLSKRPAQIVQDKSYFIQINSSLKTYAWEYTPEGLGHAADPSDDYYTRGSAWYYEGEIWDTKLLLGRDFLFKTYVLRSPELDQNCSKHSDSGVGTNFYLAQTFTPNRPGDLMMVNLSLRRVSVGKIQNITVKIYDLLPEDPTMPNGLLATAKRKGFNENHFIWRQANFTNNPPYLETGNRYAIVIKSEGVDNYEWEIAEHGNDWYVGGEAHNYGAGGWAPLDADFIFKTYMDDFG